MRAGAAQRIGDPAPVDLGLPQLVGEAAGSTGSGTSAAPADDEAGDTGVLPPGYTLDLGREDPVGFPADNGGDRDEFSAAAIHMSMTDTGVGSEGGDGFPGHSLLRMGPSGAMEMALHPDTRKFLGDPIGEVAVRELQERRWGGFEQSLEARAQAGADATPHERAGLVRSSVTALRSTCVSLHRKVRELGYLVCAASSDGKGTPVDSVHCPSTPGQKLPTTNPNE